MRKRGKWSAHRSDRAHVERDRSLRMRRTPRTDRSRGCVSKVYQNKCGSVSLDGTAACVRRRQPNREYFPRVSRKVVNANSATLFHEARVCKLRSSGLFAHVCTLQFSLRRLSCLSTHLRRGASARFGKLSCNSVGFGGVSMHGLASLLARLRYVSHAFPFRRN